MVQDLNVQLKQMSVNSVEKPKFFTIHCGDLSLNTTTSEIRDLFKDFKTTHVSLKKTPNGQYSFAYVSFDDEEEMNKALEELNYSTLKDKEIIMSAYDDKIKSQGGHNVFVNNLPKDIRCKILYSTFKVFGDIITCKAATDINGDSKGYGFVKYKTIESAQAAVDQSKILKIGENVLNIELYDTKKFRRNSDRQAVFTNCFVKNFPPDYTKEELSLLLGQFGEITDTYFPLKDDEQTSRGFACVNFKSPESAQNAIQRLHNGNFFTHEEMRKEDCFALEPFYIQKSEKKKSRIDTIIDNNSGSMVIGPRLKKNLYVKNIPDSFSKEEVLNVLAEFGSVTDFFLSHDATDQSKMFGFVCYATVEEAAIALEKSKEVLLDGNQLELSIYRSKSEREALHPINDSHFKNTRFLDEEQKKERIALYNKILAISSEFANEFSKIDSANDVDFAIKITDFMTNDLTDVKEALKNSKEVLKVFISKSLTQLSKNLKIKEKL